MADFSISHNSFRDSGKTFFAAVGVLHQQLKSHACTKPYLLTLIIISSSPATILNTNPIKHRPAYKQKLCCFSISTQAKYGIVCLRLLWCTLLHGLLTLNLCFNLAFVLKVYVFINH